MSEPDEVAAGNVDPFRSTDGLPLRDVLAGVDVWRLEQAAVGAIVDLDGGPGEHGLHLGLVEHDPDEGAEPHRAAIVVRFTVDDLSLLVGEIVAALTPAARRGLGQALLEGPA